MTNAVIVDAVRTPGGRRNGQLKDWHPVDLAAEVLKEIIKRNNLDPAMVDLRVGVADEVDTDLASGCIPTPPVPPPVPPPPPSPPLQPAPSVSRDPASSAGRKIKSPTRAADNRVSINTPKRWVGVKVLSANTAIR